MLAVIEHLHNPEEVIEKCHKHLKKQGKLIITTPIRGGDRLYKIFLRILGYKEKGVGAKHEKIYTILTMEKLLKRYDFDEIHSKRFQLGMNQIFVATK